MNRPDSCPVRELTHVPRAVAIGAFDGVHLGHAAVVRSVLEAAERLGVTSTALTFEPTPRQYFGRDEAARTRLTPDPERVGLLCNLGVEQVVVQSFDEELRSQSPEEFVRRTLVEALDAKFVAIGTSHTFGSGRGAGPEALVEFGRELGFEVYVVPLVSLGEMSVSSTDIRAALAEGDTVSARRMLGRPYTVVGTVQRGHQRGTGLGWPTANVTIPEDKYLPRDGVYAGVARANGLDGPLVPAAVSLGPAPSVGVEERRLEAHLLDFEGDVYGRELGVGFLEYLRPIEAFDSMDELNARVREDIERTREVFQGLG